VYGKICAEHFNELLERVRMKGIKAEEEEAKLNKSFL
jgi:hypothetical protein